MKHLYDRKEQWNIALKIAKDESISPKGRMIGTARIIAPLLYEIKLEQLRKAFKSK